jgi:hypothetical protein
MLGNQLSPPAWEKGMAMLLLGRRRKPFQITLVGKGEVRLALKVEMVCSLMEPSRMGRQSRSNRLKTLP